MRVEESRVSPSLPVSQIVRVAEEQAAKIKADAEAEAAALRKETDLFIDSRMASFESVLHKTSSQVRTARARLDDHAGWIADRRGHVDAALDRPDADFDGLTRD